MSETLEILQDNLGKALWDTFFMVGVATLVGVVLGTALAVLLYLTQHRLFTPNHAVNEMVGFVVNAIRSMPFLILLVVLIPLIQLLIGDPYTPTGGAIALSIAAVPFFARVAESAFQEVDEGLLEAAISTGAPLRQIIFGAIFPQALPSYIRGIVLTIISLLGYSAMVGTIGAGGIGDLAIQYGYNRYETGVLVAIVLLLIGVLYMLLYLGILNTLTGVIVVAIALRLPGSTFIIRNFFAGIPQDIENSALVDGCNRLTAFFQVIIHMVKPGLASISIFAFMSAWSNYLLFNVLIFNTKTPVLATYLRVLSRNDQMIADYGVFAAMAMVYMLPVLIFFFISQRQLMQGTISGGKGI